VFCLCGLPDCKWPGRKAFGGLYTGQVVVTEGSRTDSVSKMVAWATGSWLTHCFMVTGPNELVEAYVPRVRTSSLSDRLKELIEEDRAFYVLDLPGLTLSDRCKLARTAHGYVGRMYDVGQAILSGLAKKFVDDGKATIICSKATTGIFKDALSVSLFEGSNSACTPADLLKSRLTLVKFKPSSRITTSTSPIGGQIQT
jgi:hypothetical protein